MPDVLALLASTLTTVTKIKEVAEKIRDVEIRTLVADLQLELAEVKIRLADMMNENTQLKTQIQNAVKPQFPSCPKCGLPNWRVEKSVEDPTFGDMGGMLRTMKCGSCGFEENKLVT